MRPKRIRHPGQEMICQIQTFSSSYENTMNRYRSILTVLGLTAATTTHAAATSQPAPLDKAKLTPFLEKHCIVCHDAGLNKGGLDLDTLGRDLSDPATMAKWVRIQDRVESGEMPPKKKKRPSGAELIAFIEPLADSLTQAHAISKAAVLRRLNRREYENTLNDLFGTNLKLAPMLPEDSLSHGFDNIGESLSISLPQMRAYLEAIDHVLDTAIEKRTAKPKIEIKRASYAESREGKQFIPRLWKKIDDGAVVFFKSQGYPSGMLRDANVSGESGRYKIRVTGYAHQSDKPITFSIGSTTFVRGAEKPTYGYFSMPPGEPTTIEIEAWIERRYMIQIEPIGISDRDNEIRKNGTADYAGPGLAILQVELEGPLIEEFPSRGHRLIFDGLKRDEIQPRNPNDKKKRWYQPKFEIASSSPGRDVSPVLQRIASAAFRRPATKAEIAPYAELFETELNTGDSFENALRTAARAIFCSSKFLYFREKPGQLDDHALASRLSYFLTRTAPDAELMAAANAGKLTGVNSELLKQTDRLLDDARVERFIEDFTDAWLDLRSIEFTNPDRKLFPEFDAYLQYSMLKETRGFFASLLRENGDIANFIDSDFAFINDRLAQHYEVPGVVGPEFRKVKLPTTSPRGGVMAHASVLKISANGTTTSPVVRGTWTLERILGTTPPPPPPAVPGVEPDIRGAETIRQLLDKHRNMSSCRGCHQLIDPPGFALESFNPIGGQRDRYRAIGAGERVNKEVNGRRVNYRLGLPVDDSGEIEGAPFANFDEFKKLVMADKDRVSKCLTEKLLTFAAGRKLGFSDRTEVNRIVNDLDRKGGGLRDLVNLIVLSEVFQNK